MRTLKTRQVLAILCAFSLSLALRADDVTDKGREIFKKNQKAVVTIEVVQKVAASGRSAARESKQNATGTVIDPSGLIVVALSSCDPAELYRRLSEEYKTEIEISDVKILTEDGTEIPAEIVLRDKDLDLAFIRPKTKLTTPMAAIDLSNSGSADILDQVVALNRLKQAAGRAFSASLERVSAVVHKPRTFYIPDGNMTETGLGSPAFGMDGKIIGLVVVRAVNAQSGGNYRDYMTGIILPAGDILKAAAQAPEAKGDDGKKDASKDAPKPAAKDPAKDAVAPILKPDSAK